MARNTRQRYSEPTAANELNAAERLPTVEVRDLALYEQILKDYETAGDDRLLLAGSPGQANCGLKLTAAENCARRAQ